MSRLTLKRALSLLTDITGNVIPLESIRLVSCMNRRSLPTNQSHRSHLPTEFPSLLQIQPDPY